VTDPGSGAIAETMAQVARVPAELVLAVFRRYGRPLEQPMPPRATDDEYCALLLDGGRTAGVRALQVRTPVDVIANDYFVLEAPGAEPLAVSGAQFAGALTALERAARR
jgi:hypothetical protein